jgi:malonate decarboxylase gamma subunit
MNWHDLAAALFGPEHNVSLTDGLLFGTACFDGQPVTVIGTTDHAEIGIQLALAQSDRILETVRCHPGRPILLLIDTCGQMLRRREELLGINRAMAHLAMCLALARRSGHRVIGLVYDQALSGGFITSGLMADMCYALPDAEIRVMRLPAMARITKLPLARLEALSASNPVFAPGVANYVAMGGVRSIWRGDLRVHLREALVAADQADTRARDGELRGGRLHAAAVMRQVSEA